MGRLEAIGDLLGDDDVRRIRRTTRVQRSRKATCPGGRRDTSAVSAARQQNASTGAVCQLTVDPLYQALRAGAQCTLPVQRAIVIGDAVEQGRIATQSGFVNPVEDKLLPRHDAFDAFEQRAVADQPPI